nr:hypothetical protein [Bacteroidaceae bacterium]
MKKILTTLLLCLCASLMHAQVIGGNVYGGGEKGKVEGNSEVIIKSGQLGTYDRDGVTSGGNVYGGGNEGDLLGHTTVKLQGGDIRGGVFGGAQQADVKKYTYVNVDGENQLHDLTVNRVFGGNDVSGEIGADLDGTEGAVDGLPFTPDVNTPDVTVDNTWQSFILTTKEKSEDLNIFIGQMFGGGNGDYDYTTGNASTNPYYGKTAPTVDRTYLQINGGTYGYVFAGGNNATINEETVISINNTSTITTATDHLDLTAMSSIDDIHLDNHVDWRLLSMGINISTFHTGHHFNRVFGGNNKADMKIMPTWNLTAGDIHDLYSGGNEGRMTSPQGILLEIKKESNISAINVFGGCRKADVRPLNGIYDVSNNDIQLADPAYKFPAGFAARTLVRGGTITNVYGGNDISGKVYGGNAVGIYTSILGDVYGGGNGSYAYTDQENLKNDLIWGDFYYDPSTASSSVEALNAIRPNAEQVSLRLWGESATNRTIIGGSVYVGGNSATLKTSLSSPKVELKIGSHVIADNVFLGNNGENMIDEEVLARYAGTVTKADMTTGNDFSTLDLRDASIFASYMDGCAMTIRPSVVFDDTDNGDPSDYQNYTSYFGSFFGGGNVGSMVMPGKVTFNFNKEVIIFSKLVGGCNNANIAAGIYNAAYNGGVIGSAAEQDSYLDDSGNIKDRIVLNLNGVKLVPLRWKLQEATQQPSEGDDLTNLYLFTIDEEGVVKRATGNAVAGVTYYQQLNESGKVCLTPGDQPVLEYNVFDRGTDLPILALDASSLATGTSSDADLLRRHKGANVYGACYNSGHVNGNVVINLNNTIHDCDKIFDEIDESDHLDAYTSYTITQRHTGVILNEQAMDVSIPSLAVFGAGYGEASEVWGSATINLNKGFTFQIYGGGERGIVGKASDLTYNGAYSTCSNLNGTIPGVAVGATGDSEDMADAVFVYGGSYEGLILGDTQVNLGNGRVYNAIAGSCTADIYGHSEMYIGRGTSDDDNHGFPWVADDVYGGNDVAGEIKGSADFTSRVREAARSLVYDTDVLTATSYVEYQQGRVSSIFGGSCGDFDYTGDSDYSIYADFVADKDVPLFVENTFVNFSPLVDNSSNRVAKVFGAGQGHVDGAFKDKMQERSYVLVDVPQGMTTFTTTEIFGAGSYGGVGMSVLKATADANESGVEASAVVDLVRGQVAAAYGGSYNQGVTRRTIVNVPSGSTSVLNNIFGGAYGTEDGTHSNKAPCDVYQSIVNYGSANARINGALYGGNNNYRRTLYTQVNLTVPLKQSNGYDGYIYGAGKGTHTWAQYTEVNLENGSSLYEVYGGGDAGKVLNEKSLTAWNGTLSAENMNTIQLNLTTDDATTGYTENYLTNSLARTSELYTDLSGRYKTCDETKTYDEKYNTNVLIKQGALVKNYAYGGGYGTDAVVSGSTYIALLGGKVNKDMYAAGTSGAVKDLYGTTSNHFSASATAYVRGGSVRNVYGGGWEGDVGYHDKTTTATTTDIPGETHVVIGRKTCPDDSGLTFYDGKPVVQRNAYGGGEGGAVFGDAHITLFNGYIGYYYDSDTDAYLEDLNDETATDGVGENLLLEAGNIFGSGYADYSNADNTEVALYGGVVRNSIYGGGEIGTVGRGISNGTIYKGGSTNVMMFEGHVLRNAFGGGRGYDNLNRISSIGTSGYVFGSTKIHIHGGEVGTEEGVANGDGNVFGGGNIGFVYSALGTKQGTEGYYYDSSGHLTEDCSVVIAPWTKVTSAEGLTLNGTTYEQCNYVPAEALNFLKNKSSDSESWSKVDDAGVVVRNAVFAGGNVSTGSDQVYANTKTVFGNATATIYDIYNRDLITLGTEHVGGLYGDGNLTFVDGYRELNITNYGTDYYGMSDNITYDQYQNLSDRERAYFELNYKCTKSYTSTTLGEVSLNKKISEEDWNALPDAEKDNWTLAGFCTIYAGRLMNTIQRADFCGIFGSRMVLQGALDRVPSEVDYKPYTINRVGELSLNKSQSLAVDDTDPEHGCYFGIYSLVNYLGALTTDVDFHEAKRKWDTGLANPYVADSDSPGQTYAQWKERHLNERKRNNGVCDHKVALASGVYLEITKEESTKDNKVWGPITGVCQLDLIDVSTGLGGGYVYAKNIHGTRSASGNNQTILSTYNKAGHGHAAGVTNKIWTYAEATSSDEMETSGNFIHNYKQIVDDCYPVGHSYSGSGASAAHYWFIRGDIYIYDQYISAYTGSASAYAETIDLPLTITPASGGKLRLVNVQPNFYAYYDDA